MGKHTSRVSADVSVCAHVCVDPLFVCVFVNVYAWESTGPFPLHYINNDELQIDYPGVKALVLNLLRKAATCELHVSPHMKMPIALDLLIN